MAAQIRPILLKGHERSVTHLQFSAAGDLLFSASKSYQPTVWLADSGERVGTYNGHNGAVWRLDVTCTCCTLMKGLIDDRIIKSFLKILNLLLPCYLLLRRDNMINDMNNLTILEI